ncbi:TonB-dependent receptor [Spongiibacter taiwanensis]|uniref:TonB-dependent receptor n=1 Tax=Spongiibacter taiwanensis TaxID=1748242 RepID=UPI002035667F|nr:TonB-dependent receptor [Spongiibacter taiwanensis]USA42451.1 TonB-dependent receptor [Spongiibacter taiwanensis]
MKKRPLDKSFRLSLIGSAVCAATLTLPQHALSQTRGSVLEEVTVTAQKREESASDVGIAISAFSAEQLEALNFKNAADVAMQSPNVEIRRHFVGKGLTTNLFIRGVGNTDLNNGAESPVAGFVDEFYMISSSTVDFSLYDMARTEILKGPQGTLFGRNATGGAFSFFTQKPEDEFSAYAEGTTGTDGILRGEGRLNLPVNDQLKLRISAFHDSHDGFTENTYPGRDDFREGNFNAFRFQALYDVSEQWEALLKFESGEAEGNLVGDNLNPMMKQGDDIVFAPTNGLGQPKDADPFKVAHNSADWASNEVNSFLLTNNFYLDDLTITAITGLLDQDFELTEDCDASPVSICNYHSFYESKHFSQEVRLNKQADKYNLTVGVYYLNQDADGGLNLNVFNGLVDPNDPDGGILQATTNDIEVEAYALFGQFDYYLTEEVTLIAGLRAQNDKKDFSQSTYQYYVSVADFDFDGPSDFRAPNITIEQTLQSNIFTPSSAGDLTKIDKDSYAGTLQANWTPTDEALYYASFRRGVKAGGFNVGVVPLGLAPEAFPYDQETLNAYEVGGKLSFMDGKTRVNMATFYYDYKDYQALSFENLGQFFENREASITGAELEVFTNPMQGLDIILGVSYLDTEVEGVIRAGTEMDTEMGEAPNKTANLVARYEWPVATGYVSAQIDGTYVAERYGDILNQTAATLKSYSVWGANVTYTHADEKFFVRLWAKNLGDKEVATYRIEVTDLANTGQDNFMEPRTAGITVGYHF